MKLVRPADGSLIVRVRPGLFPEGLLALVIPLPLWKLLAEGPYPTAELPMLLLGSLIAAVALSWVAEVSDFTFDAARSELRWSRKTVYSRDGGRVPLRDIRAVSVASQESRSEGYFLHRVVLSLRKGSVPMTRSFSTGRRSELVAQAVHDFLAARGLPKVEPEPPKRTAVAFHLEADGRWAAQLDCGHRVYPRHEPPWVDLLTESGRKAAVGMTAACEQCEAGAHKGPAP